MASARAARISRPVDRPGAGPAAARTLGRMSSHDPEPALVERTGVLAGDPALLRERDAALGALTTVRHPALAPLVRAVAVGDAHALTHLVPAGGVELASLRQTVPLRPGHVVTVLAAVLDALDAVHRAHLAHGGVTGERVLVGPDGSVVLGACGLAWSVPPGCDGGPLAADDIAEVAVLARHLLGSGTAPPALVIALLRATDPDAALRPDAASLAAAVRAAVAPEPLLDLLWLAAPGARAPRTVAGPGDDLPIAGDTVVPTGTAAVGAVAATRVPRPASRRRRGPSRVRAAGLGLAVLGLPVLVWSALRGPVGAAADPGGVASSTSPAPSPSSPSPAVPTPAGSPATDWRSVLVGLDALRHRALVAGSSALLAEAVDPRGTAWAADAALADRVRRTGAHLDGGAVVVSAVDLVSSGTDRVLLRVEDRRAAYAVTADGTTTHVPARAGRIWVVTLVRGGAGWRIGDVRAAAGPTGQ